MRKVQRRWHRSAHKENLIRRDRPDPLWIQED